MRRRAEHPLRALRALRGRDERGDERERGSVAMYVVLFTPAVFLLAGLLVDGGLAIHARQRAADMAEQAARVRRERDRHRRAARDRQAG